MGFFRKLFRREFRAAVVTADDNIMRIINSVEVSPETAMEIPAVSACVGFISYCIASLPIKLYREDREKNVTEEIKNDPRLRLLNDETGDLLDPFQMKQAVIEDFFLHGAGFIYPEMYGNEFISLRYIDHNHISSINRGVDPVFKSGQYVLSNGMELWDDRVIKFLRETKDGLTGKSIIDQHQQILSAMYKEIVYEKLLVASGGNKKGFITAETKLSDESMAELRKAWNQMYANTGNTMMILNKGLAFHESSNTSVEMQLLENKVRNNELVCQLFRMSPAAVSGKLSDEEMASTIKSAVVPVITAFENALDRGLLLPSERDLMYYGVDTTELLKGDILKRYQAYKLGLESNVLQIDEARYKEDLPPLGLHWIKLGLQDVLFEPKTNTIYTPNMNRTMQMSESKLPETVKKPVDKGGRGGIIEEREAVFGEGHKIVDNTPEGGDESGAGSLTEREKSALNAYISSESYKINEKLRTGQKLTDEEQQMVDDLDSALDKLPKFEGTVYRSLSSDMMNDEEEFWSTHFPDAIVTYSAFTSASTSIYDDTMDIQIEIDSKTARDIRGYNPRENEVLFQREPLFRIKKVKGKKIFMEEI